MVHETSLEPGAPVRPTESKFTSDSDRIVPIAGALVFPASDSGSVLIVQTERFLHAIATLESQP